MPKRRFAVLERQVPFPAKKNRRPSFRLTPPPILFPPWTRRFDDDGRKKWPAQPEHSAFGGAFPADEKKKSRPKNKPSRGPGKLRRTPGSKHEMRP